MNQVERIQKDLNTILKYGDLYDVISEKEDLKINKGPFVKSNILLFSRILYAGLLVIEKIKNKFTPIQKVKEATDEIRKTLKVRVDIVKSKELKEFYDVLLLSHLQVLYEEDYVYVEKYVENLKKILSFCELYNIEQILLRKKDLAENFYGIDLGEYENKSIAQIYYTTLQYDSNELFIVLDREQLLELIKKIEIIRYDKKVITELTKKIKDIVIENAVSKFYLYDDIDKLKETVANRLMLEINSDNSSKDKRMGKIFETVTIEGEYIKVVKSNQEGEIISNAIMTLYDYLEVTSYQALIEQSEFVTDKEEIFRISALHLYLIQNEKKRPLKENTTMTFCDKVYHSFCEKQKNNQKKVWGTRRRIDKWGYNIISTLFSIHFYILVFVVYFLTGVSLDFVSEHLFNVEEPMVLETMVKTLLKPYKYSYELEKEIIDTIIEKKNEIELDFGKVRTGDALSIQGLFDKDVDEDTAIATIQIIDDSFRSYMPTYYASGYGESGIYKKGELNFDIVSDFISPTDLEEAGYLFEVRFDVTRKDIKSFLNGNEIKFPKVLYPVGMQYAISRVTIMDNKDENKFVVIDASTVKDNVLTNEEVELLLSMKRPEVRYGYGFGNQYSNLFLENLGERDNYTSLSLEKVRKAILDGLGLNEEAEMDEIYTAIKNKDYSTTPIKDAKLSHKIKKMDEKEYFETIASMDSLICNLAAMLAVEVNENLTYVVGYANIDGNDFITANECHAWAMEPSGSIIDVTPSSTNEEDDNITASIIKECIDFGIRHHLPFYLIATIVAFVIKKYFGKDIIMHIKINEIKKVLGNPNSYKTYAKIKDILYGESNIPCEKNIEEFIDMIDKEFASLTLEELQELRSMLHSSLKGSELHQAKKMIKEIPYIREHSDELQKVFYKVKK